jgi:hypothetical protein
MVQTKKFNFLGGNYMILFLVLLCVIVAAILVGLFSTLIAGAGFLVVFGDLVAFAALIWMIVKLVKKRKKSKE